MAPCPCCTHGRWPRQLPKTGTLSNPPCSSHIPCCSPTPSPACPAFAPLLSTGTRPGKQWWRRACVRHYSGIIQRGFPLPLSEHWTTRVRSCRWGSALHAGVHQSQTEQFLGARAALPVHRHCARARSWGRSWQLCGILICLSPSLLLLFVFTVAMANDTIPQTGSHACNHC